MSQGGDDFEDFLRRELHAAADPVEPSQDGLARIRSRLTRPRPVLRAWAAGACSGAARRARGGFHTLMGWWQAISVAAKDRWRRGPPPSLPRRRWAWGCTPLAVVLVTAALAVAVGLFAPPR